MLPDLPELKREIQAVLSRYLHNAVSKRLGVFSEVPRHTVHEGESMRISRADGSVRDSGMKPASAEMTMNYAEIPNLTAQDRRKQLDDLADQMARQMSEHLFGSLNEDIEKAGQVVSAGGRPLTADVFFEVLEKLEVDFDEAGNPKGLQLVVGPDLMPRIRELAEQERRDPAIRRRHDEIMQKKWLEWRDREAARKLVG
jgi:hypothetical protein